MKRMLSLIICIIVTGCMVSCKTKSNISLKDQIIKAKSIADYDMNTTISDIDTVVFGQCPQNDIAGEIKYPIEWVIVDKQENTALLLSKYILDCKQLNEESRSVGWNTCTLRDWLNNDFYEIAFNNEEKRNIIPKQSLVFLLELEDIRQYFDLKNAKDYNFRLATNATEYAKTIAARSADGYGLYWYVHDDWSSENSSFWTGTSDNTVNSMGKWIYLVDGHGSTAYAGGVSNYYGVRPAIWVSY